jgi:hypothetical protein
VARNFAKRAEKSLRVMVPAGHAHELPRLGFVAYQLRAGPGLAHSYQKGVHQPGQDLGAFFVGKMPGAWQELKLHPIKALAQVLGRIQ